MSESPLELWLKYVSADGIILAQARLDGDWGIQMGRAEGSYFHFVAQGSACYSVEDGPAVELCAGDLLILPQGAPHHLKSGADSQVTPLLQFARELSSRQSEAPDATVVMCGQFGVDRHMVLPAIQALPRALHLRADDTGVSAIPQTLKQLRSELDSARIGNKIIIRHLLSTLFIYVLREWATLAPAESNTWFSAMQNGRVAKALAGIHKSPDKPWTLESLAEEAGLSRAAFARQFRESVGETPHGYLTRWRMGIAAQLLSQTALSVSEVAYRTGYQSEDSFNRAFKAARGMTPTQARERAGTDAPGHSLIG